MSKTSLRVMFINLENLFSAGIPFYFNDGYQQEEYQAKVAWIGHMIAQGNVHLVGMSELGDEAEAGLEAVMAAANQHDMEIYNDHVFRHQTITTSSATAAEKLWKLKTSDHGVMVIEFTRMLG